MRYSKHGFTLIELAVAIVILGMAAAIAFPRLHGGALGRANLRAGLSRLAAVATYARNQAACTRRMHRLHLDLENSEYWVTRQDPDGSYSPVSIDGDELRARLPSDIMLDKLETEDPGRVSEGIATLRFSPNGWADQAVVEITGPDGGRAMLSIRGVSGRVETGIDDE